MQREVAMKDMKDVLSTKESKPENKLLGLIRRERAWYRGLREEHKVQFLSTMIIDPIVVIFFFYYLTAHILCIPLTYLILDTIIYRYWKKKDAEVKRLEELESQDRSAIIRQKIEELRVIEMEAKEREAARQKELEEKRQRRREFFCFWHKRSGKESNHTPDTRI